MNPSHNHRQRFSSLLVALLLTLAQLQGMLLPELLHSGLVAGATCCCIDSGSTCGCAAEASSPTIQSCPDGPRAMLLINAIDKAQLTENPVLGVYGLMQQTARPENELSRRRPPARLIDHPPRHI